MADDLKILINSSGAMCPLCLESQLVLTMDVSATFNLAAVQKVKGKPWQLWAPLAGMDVWPMAESAAEARAEVSCMAMVNGRSCGFQTTLTEGQYEDVYACLEQQ